MCPMHIDLWHLMLFSILHPQFTFTSMYSYHYCVLYWVVGPLTRRETDNYYVKNWEPNGGKKKRKDKTKLKIHSGTTEVEEETFFFVIERFILFNYYCWLQLLEFMINKVFFSLVLLLPKQKLFYGSCQYKKKIQCKHHNSWMCRLSLSRRTFTEPWFLIMCTVYCAHYNRTVNPHLNEIVTFQFR